MTSLTSSPRHPVLGLASLLSVHSPHRKRAFPLLECFGTPSTSQSIHASLVSFKPYLLLTSSSGNSSRKSTTPVSGGTPPLRLDTKFTQRSNLSIGASFDLPLSDRDEIETKRSANLLQMEIFRSDERERTRARDAYRENVMGCAVVYAFMIAVESFRRVSEALRGDSLRVWVDKGVCLADICHATYDIK
jgi:hypothetical protein